MPISKSKILFLAASPADMSPLALDEESRAIGQKIRTTDHRDSLELVTKWAVRPDDLLEYLNEYRPHVVHFSGHGTDQQQIVLVDDSRGAIPVSAQALRLLFTTLKDNIRVVVLNACFSQTQAEAIVQVIDCAVGMKQEIGDNAAITFAASFYRAVGYGRSVQDAFEQGTVALLLQGIPEEDTPTLLVRDGVDPDELFLVDGETQDPVATPGPPGPQGPPAPVSTPPASPSLANVLPGRWQVRIQMGWAVGQMALEMSADYQFRGELTGPMGSGTVDGQWQVDEGAGQIGFQGRISSGFQVGPYMVAIRVTHVDQQQIVGVTHAGEQVTWQRIG